MSAGDCVVIPILFNGLSAKTAYRPYLGCPQDVRARIHLFPGCILAPSAPRITYSSACGTRSVSVISTVISFPGVM